jgi:hypothetical protein
MLAHRPGEPTANYLGLYPKEEHSTRPDENAKLLCVHLKQRFELRALMFRNGQSCFPDAEELFANLPNCIAR